MNIVGAGFSGLTLAYELTALGVPVKVFESQAQAGGLIATRVNRFGLVETAANAFLANADIERLFKELGLEFACQRPSRRRRYIFTDSKPRRWPLSIKATLKLLPLVLAQLTRREGHWPRPFETVHQWASRVVGVEIEQRLLAPALQGVYAGDIGRLSASLVLGRLFRGPRPRRGHWRGSVSPKNGMGELTRKLSDAIVARGGKIQYSHRYVLSENVTEPTILCTSAWAAAQILSAREPESAALLARCESLPLVSVTAFFPHQTGELRGFGCLFPESQGFHALGVLFADGIFADRSEQRAETWILGGARQMQVMTLDDEGVTAALAEDRRRLTGQPWRPLSVDITRWPRALPHYTVEWERALSALSVPAPLFLHGNYLGHLGLAQIHQRSRTLARELKEKYAG